MNTPSAVAIGLQQGRENRDFQNRRFKAYMETVRANVEKVHVRHPPRPRPADPKDATIATLTEQRDLLKAEVERLAEGLKFYEPAIVRKAERERAASLLRRLGLTLAAIFLAGSLYAAPAPRKAPRHTTKPISTITVKVVAQADFLRGAPAGQRGPWRITTADLDGCTAWVDDSAPDVTAAEVLALRACRMKIDMAVDAAHDRAEKGGR